MGTTEQEQAATAIKLGSARVLANNCPDNVGKEVLIKGWIHSIRLLGSIAFVVIRDRSAKIQVVVDDKELLNELKEIQYGTTVAVTGKIQESDKTDLGVEMIEPKFEFYNKVTEGWPIEINKPTLSANLDTQLEHRALALRHDHNAAIFKIQGTMAQAYREYMVDNGFTEFFGPSMIASSSEGGAEIFKVDYFGKQATLAQSNQLYKQMMVGVYERVFGMAKWFRAENSNTRRHLTEGMQYEFELGFIEGLEDIFDHLEGAIRHMYLRVEEKCSTQLAQLDIKLAMVPATGKFPVYTFADAIAVYAERSGEDVTGWKDLTPESEKELCAYAREKYGSDFIIVKHYPKAVFYAYKDEDGVNHNFDLLCREAEIVSGGRRVDNYDQMVAAIKTAGMNPESFSEYLSIFRHGMPPHGGFGLGFERFTMLSLGLENIREASIFPSDPKRVAAQYLPEDEVRGADRIKKEIKQLFVDNDLEFQVMKHEPTPTSEDAARVRGLDANTGVKALILRDKKTGENLQVNVIASDKLNIKAVEKEYQEKHPGAKLEFEKPEVIEQKYGLKVGGVPPFGFVYGIETWNDSKIFDTELGGVRAFNNSDQSESLLCNTNDLESVLQGKAGDFSQ